MLEFIIKPLVELIKYFTGEEPKARDIAIVIGLYTVQLLIAGAIFQSRLLAHFDIHAGHWSSLQDFFTAPLANPQLILWLICLFAICGVYVVKGKSPTMETGSNGAAKKGLYKKDPLHWCCQILLCAAFAVILVASAAFVFGIIHFDGKEQASAQLRAITAPWTGLLIAFVIAFCLAMRKWYTIFHCPSYSYSYSRGYRASDLDGSAV